MALYRSVRVADDDWSDLADAAAATGLDRAKVINQMIGWFLRRPGVKLPARPPAAPPKPETEPAPPDDRPLLDTR